MTDPTDRNLIICDVCGKSFYRQPQHLYKMTIDSYIWNFCSYTCYRKIERIKDNKRYDLLHELKRASEEVRIKHEDN